MVCYVWLLDSSSIDHGYFGCLCCEAHLVLGNMAVVEAETVPSGPGGGEGHRIGPSANGLKCYV